MNRESNFSVLTRLFGTQRNWVKPYSWSAIMEPAGLCDLFPVVLQVSILVTLLVSRQKLHVVGRIWGKWNTRRLELLRRFCSIQLWICDVSLLKITRKNEENLLYCPLSSFWSEESLSRWCWATFERGDRVWCGRSSLRKKTWRHRGGPP